MDEINLYVYHANDDDPKKCSAKKLHRFGYVQLEEKMQRLPRNLILLNPFSQKSLSAEDMKTCEKNGILAIDCSWVHAEDDILAHMTLRPPNFGVPVWEELATTRVQKDYFKKKMDGVAKLIHPGGRPGLRHVVSIRDVVDAVMLAVGNEGSLYNAFNISGPAPFSYDVLAGYIAEKLDLPIVEFEYDLFHDFQIDLSKSRQVLGYEPAVDIFGIVDSAIDFRKSRKGRTTLKYPG